MAISGKHLYCIDFCERENVINWISLVYEKKDLTTLGILFFILTGRVVTGSGCSVHIEGVRIRFNGWFKDELEECVGFHNTLGFLQWIDTDFLATPSDIYKLLKKWE